MNNYKLIIEQFPNSDIVEKIFRENGAEINVNNNANFTGLFDVTICIAGASLLTSLAQAFMQFQSLKRERIVLVFPNGTKIRNITLEDAKQLIEKELTENEKNEI